MDMMMSQKEAKRAQVIELLTAGKIDQKEAGKRLAVESMGLAPLIFQAARPQAATPS